MQNVLPENSAINITNIDSATASWLSSTYSVAKKEMSNKVRILHVTHSCRIIDPCFNLNRSRKRRICGQRWHVMNHCVISYHNMLRITGKSFTRLWPCSYSLTFISNIYSLIDSWYLDVLEYNQDQLHQIVKYMFAIRNYFDLFNIKGNAEPSHSLH